MAIEYFVRTEYQYPPIIAQILVDEAGGLTSRYRALTEQERNGSRDITEPLRAISYDCGPEILALLATQNTVDIFGEGDARNYRVQPSVIGYLSTVCFDNPRVHTFASIDILCGATLTDRSRGVAKFILSSTDNLHETVGDSLTKLLAPLRVG